MDAGMFEINGVSGSAGQFLSASSIVAPQSPGLTFRSPGAYCGCRRSTVDGRQPTAHVMTRNSALLGVHIGHSEAGPMTKMVLDEFAAWVIGTAGSGGSIR